MKMLNEDRKHRVSGFTLIEMVVVVAIISILTAVLVPTTRAYLTRSRLHTANSQAKVLFNSMQTIMQEYEFRERGMKESVLYGAEKGGEIMIYVSNGRITDFSVTDSLGIPQTVSDDVIGADPDTASASSIGTRIGRIYTDYLTTAWCALIKDYSVQGVLAADSEKTAYIGGYPIQPTAKGTQCAGLALESLSDVTLADMQTYCTAVWKPAEGEGETVETPEET
ncbi:MAG: type II secretion system GspH family protein [Oscillospiraceae bacterium]|nr:type II secretion system GspH family protein [Oscillospiraceae bacterium]